MRADAGVSRVPGCPHVQLRGIQVRDRKMARKLRGTSSERSRVVQTYAGRMDTLLASSN